MKVAIAASEIRSSAGSYVVSFSVTSATPFIRQSFCRPDIHGLAALIAAAQQNQHCTAPLLKIHAVARTIMDAQFADPLSDRRHVAHMSVRKTVEAGGDHRPCPLVLESRSPTAKLVRLLQF